MRGQARLPFVPGPVKERQDLLNGFESANIDIVEAARIDLYRARMFLPKLKVQTHSLAAH